MTTIPCTSCGFENFAVEIKHCPMCRRQRKPLVSETQVKAALAKRVPRKSGFPLTTKLSPMTGASKRAMGARPTFKRTWKSDGNVLIEE